ncbi:type 1 glutamine amidotransferase [Staphylococcus aureus]
MTIYHFMSDKLNLYSDIGNIIALRQRAKKRNIKVNVVEINETEGITFDECDIFFIGGGSDREQALATKELSKIKTPLKEAIEDGMPGLTICGGYQFLGNIMPDGTELEGLGILDFYTESKTNRLTGDIVIESDTFGTIGALKITVVEHIMISVHLVMLLLVMVIMMESRGISYKNLLGTYLHGPILPKNYEITDYLLEKACERKGIPFEPKEIDNEAEIQAKQVLIDRANRQKKSR